MNQERGGNAQLKIERKNIFAGIRGFAKNDRKGVIGFFAWGGIYYMTTSYFIYFLLGDKKKIKLIATILYYAGISLRKTSKFLKDFEKFSHEALRQWYHKLAQLFTNSRKYSRCIAIDETKIKIGDEWYYVWLQ